MSFFLYFKGNNNERQTIGQGTGEKSPTPLDDTGKATQKRDPQLRVSVKAG